MSKSDTETSQLKLSPLILDRLQQSGSRRARLTSAFYLLTCVRRVTPHGVEPRLRRQDPVCALYNFDATVKFIFVSWVKVITEPFITIFNLYGN